MKQPPELFYKKGVLTNLEPVPESLFLNKVAGMRLQKVFYRTTPCDCFWSVSILRQLILIFWRQKILKQHQVICCDFCFKNKNKKMRIFLMSTDEELVNCVRHARGIIQTYCLFNLLMKFFLKVGLYYEIFISQVVKFFFRQFSVNITAL